jgi:hypothetical protein
VMLTLSRSKHTCGTCWMLIVIYDSLKLHLIKRSVKVGHQTQRFTASSAFFSLHLILFFFTYRNQHVAWRRGERNHTHGSLNTLE